MAIGVRVSHHGLDVASGLRERHGFDELSGLAEIAPLEPGACSRETGIVGGERGFSIPVERVGHLLEVVTSKLEVHGWLKQPGRGVLYQLEAAAEFPACGRLNLRQPSRIRGRNCAIIELRLLPDQR